MKVFKLHFLNFLEMLEVPDIITILFTSAAVVVLVLSICMLSFNSFVRVFPSGCMQRHVANRVLSWHDFVSWLLNFITFKL